MLEKDSKLDPRARRTRQMLQQSMNALMNEKSFTQITVQDIAARADVNRATFYAHFVDKYDLINSIIRDHFQAMLDEVLPENAMMTCKNLNLLIQSVYAYLSNFPGQCNSAQLHKDHGLMVQQVQYQMYVVLLEWLKHAPSRNKTEVIPDDNETTLLEVSAMMISWSIFGPILQTAWGKRKISSKQLTDQIMKLIQFSFSEYLVPDPASASTR
ncbi:MAG TPA: TetR/AcrR family transcriptional regulator [Phototrophicaceae bacterium]|jgi:AcrR family transcriptional regulator|nr:TetR/AcrR family transcriptional regulator [Phototrophicaceae bacterium]